VIRIVVFTDIKLPSNGNCGGASEIGEESIASQLCELCNKSERYHICAESNNQHLCLTCFLL
jgi:hypothetical protein